MFGFGKTEQVVPVSFHDGALSFRCSEKYSPGKSTKVQLLLTIGGRLETPQVPVVVATCETTADGYLCTGGVQLDNRKRLELMKQLTYAGIAGACRRGSRRIETIVRILSKQLPNFHAITCDVSRSGVQLICDGVIAPGSYLNLTFDLDIVGFPELTMQAVCIRCVEDYEGTGSRNAKSRLGVAFTQQHPETHAAWDKFYDHLLAKEGSSLMSRALGDVGPSRAEQPRPAGTGPSAPPPPPPPPSSQRPASPAPQQAPPAPVQPAAAYPATAAPAGYPGSAAGSGGYPAPAAPAAGYPGSAAASGGYPTPPPAGYPPSGGYPAAPPSAAQPYPAPPVPGYAGASGSYPSQANAPQPLATPEPPQAPPGYAAASGGYPTVPNVPVAPVQDPAGAPPGYPPSVGGYAAPPAAPRPPEPAHFSTPPMALTFDSMAPPPPPLPQPVQYDPVPVQAMGIDGDSIVFRAREDAQLRAGNVRPVVLELQYNGQRTNAVLMVAVSRVDSATAGICLCWGTLREDAQKIELLNQVLAG